jgi:hypothetical protein
VLTGAPYPHAGMFYPHAEIAYPDAGMFYPHAGMAYPDEAVLHYHNIFAEGSLRLELTAEPWR